MRSLVAVFLVVVLLGLGYAAGRLLPAHGGSTGRYILPGDRPLAASWESFLQQQQDSLSLLQSSEFHGDDPERAEAYYALLHDLSVAIDAGESTAGSPLSGKLPPSDSGLPLTPNAMAEQIQQITRRLAARTDARLGAARAGFSSSTAAITPGPRDGTPRIAVSHWDLDNEHALLVRFPAGSSGAAVNMGNVWAMQLTVAGIDDMPMSRLDCQVAGECLGVLAHSDPGVPGWLDTGGHRRGLLVLQWRGSAAAPVIERMRVSDLVGTGAAIPAAVPPNPESEVPP